MRQVPGAARAGDRTSQADEYLGLLDSVGSNVLRAGVCLQEALALPPDLAQEHVQQAIRCLDDVIRQIRDAAFSADA